MNSIVKLVHNLRACIALHKAMLSPWDLHLTLGQFSVKMFAKTSTPLQADNGNLQAFQLPMLI